jgi:hypothetical protein
MSKVKSLIFLQFFGLKQGMNVTERSVREESLENREMFFSPLVPRLELGRKRTRFEAGSGPGFSRFGLALGGFPLV